MPRGCKDPEWFESQGRRMWDQGLDTYCRILEMLGQRPRTTTELAKYLGMTSPGVRYHLRRMLQAGSVVVHSVEMRPGPVEVYTRAPSRVVRSMAVEGSCQD